ncbi:MAG: hypothetical protein V3S60_02995 [Acidimicrobiia bacterium]
MGNDPPFEVELAAVHLPGARRCIESFQEMGADVLYAPGLTEISDI